MEIEYTPVEEKRRLEGILLRNMRQHEPELRRVLEDATSESCYEDGICRYYYESFKVFWLQNCTKLMVDALAAISPEGRPFCSLFGEIIRQGTGREFSPEDNQNWVKRATPITLAFFHAKYFVEMAVKSAELEEPPQSMPCGWAALLCLYGIR